MKGTRVEHINEMFPFEDHPGYYSPVTIQGKRTWMCITPNGHGGDLANHEVVEHEDGTITVSPSILVSGSEGELWHGYLERGIWRSV